MPERNTPHRGTNLLIVCSGTCHYHLWHLSGAVCDSPIPRRIVPCRHWCAAGTLAQEKTYSFRSCSAGCVGGHGCHPSDDWRSCWYIPC